MNAPDPRPPRLTGCSLAIILAIALLAAFMFGFNQGLQRSIRVRDHGRKVEAQVRAVYVPIDKNHGRVADIDYSINGREYHGRVDVDFDWNYHGYVVITYLPEDPTVIASNPEEDAVRQAIIVAVFGFLIAGLCAISVMNRKSDLNRWRRNNAGSSLDF